MQVLPLFLAGCRCSSFTAAYRLCLAPRSFGDSRLSPTKSRLSYLFDKTAQNLTELQSVAVNRKAPEGIKGANQDPVLQTKGKFGFAQLPDKAAQPIGCI
jgi:hypothetical protein